MGPPGTGKTLIARAIAGEAQVPFLSITGSEFMEMFVGVGAARVRDLFKTARQDKPSIIFIDEIDAIGRKRGTGLGGGHDEREQTLNQILSEMDGFEPAEGIIVMAATNRPDVLDPALLRAGRFDRQIVVPLPTLEERVAILQVHCKGKRVSPDANLETIAKSTPGMSGADLENLVNEAALIAVRRGSARVEMPDLEAALDRVLLGLKRTSLVLSPDEKRIVAYHESGHTLVAHLLPNADPVHKVTILPSGMALGATQQLPEERQLQQRPSLDDALAVLLGGRASEELVFGVPSTGAQNDLTAATDLAGRMVREWGMSDAIGEMSWGPQGPVFLGEDLIHTREVLRRDGSAHRRGGLADPGRAGGPGPARAQRAPGGTRRARHGPGGPRNPRRRRDHPDRRRRRERCQAAPRRRRVSLDVDTERPGDARTRVLRIVDELARELHPRRTLPPASLHTHLDRDLGLDSLAMAELLVRLENAFGASLPSSLLSTAETPEDLLRSVVGVGAAKEAPVPLPAYDRSQTSIETIPMGAGTLLDVLDWHCDSHPDQVHVHLLDEDGPHEALTYADLKRGGEAVGTGSDGGRSRLRRVRRAHAADGPRLFRGISRHTAGGWGTGSHLPTWATITN